MKKTFLYICQKHYKNNNMIKTLSNKKDKKHISFFADKKEVIEIEKLKLFNLMMGKKNDIKSVLMDAIREKNKRLTDGGSAAKNQTDLFK